MSKAKLEHDFLFNSIGFVQPYTPTTIDESVSVKEAVSIMKQKNLGCILIVDENGKLVGIISERDILHKVVLEELSVYERVSTIMNIKPKTTTMTSTIIQVINLMVEGGYRHIPLVDKNDIPVGIVSVRSIINFITAQIQKDLGFAKKK